MYLISKVRALNFKDTGNRFLRYGHWKSCISIWIKTRMGARLREVPVSRRFEYTLPWQKCSYSINCTCGKYAIYGEII